MQLPDETPGPAARLARVRQVVEPGHHRRSGQAHFSSPEARVVGRSGAATTEIVSAEQPGPRLDVEEAGVAGSCGEQVIAGAVHTATRSTTDAGNLNGSND